MTDTKISIGDLVIHQNKIVGRVVYITKDGWAGVKDSNQRVDEYFIENLRRAE